MSFVRRLSARAMTRFLAAWSVAFLLPFFAHASAHAEVPGPPPTQGVVNVNTAKIEELMLLPRIGESKAQRIIELRTKTPFKTVNDLTRVKGIGLKTLRLLKPYVRVDGATTLTSEVKPEHQASTPSLPTRPAPAPLGTGGTSTH